MSYKKSGILISVVIVVIVILLYCIFGIEIKDTGSKETSSTPTSLSEDIKSSNEVVSSSKDVPVESVESIISATLDESSVVEVSVDTKSEVTSEVSVESSKVSSAEVKEDSKLVSEQVSNAEISKRPMALDDVVSPKTNANELIEIDLSLSKNKSKDRTVIGLISSKHMYYYDNQVYYQFEIIDADGNYYKYFVPESAYMQLSTQSSVKMKLREYTVKDKVVTCVLSVETTE